jgi:hypothetical protein
MPRVYIKQPDGRIAVFSTVLKVFVDTGTTPEQLAHEAAEEAAAEAYRAVLAAAERAKNLGKSRDTAPDWDDACAEHLANGGDPVQLREPQGTPDGR